MSVSGRERDAGQPSGQQDSAATAAVPVPAVPAEFVTTTPRPAPEAPAGRPGRPGRGRLGWALALAAVAVVLFLAYLRVSRTVPVDSDGASNALQAWAMLHGNLLLTGWWVSDVAFYTTELPQYMLLIAARGFGPDVVHTAAAMTYVLLVLLAGLLARGRSTGPAGVARFAVAAGIMIAPQLGGGADVLLLSPDHVGTGVPLLLIWLIVDRARPRAYVPVAVGILLAWVQVADSLTLLVATGPLIAVCALRAAADLVRRRSRRPGGIRRHELGLAVAAAASVPVALLAGRLIHSHGGYTVWSASTRLYKTGTLPAHLALTGHGLLELLGADFPQQPGTAVFFAAVHLAGVALAAAGLALALRQLLKGDLIAAVLAVAIVVNVAAYVVSRSPIDSWSAREISAALPYGAVLAGRLVAGPLARRLQSPAAARGPAARGLRQAVLAAACACALAYAAALGYAASRPSQPAEDQDLAGWLTAHHLTYGLASYWQANNTTLDSSGRVHVLPVSIHHRKVTPRLWESDIGWFAPRRHYADFLVTVTGPPKDVVKKLARRALQNFGRPARVYVFGRYTVRVWHQNLLRELGPATGPG